MGGEVATGVSRADDDDPPEGTPVPDEPVPVGWYIVPLTADEPVSAQAQWVSSTRIREQFAEEAWQALSAPELLGAASAEFCRQLHDRGTLFYTATEGQMTVKRVWADGRASE